MYKHRSFLLLWLVVALTISACGFHLKGTQRAQSNIDNLYLVISRQDEVTENAIRQLLERSNIDLVEAGDSRFEVRITDSIRQRNRTAVGGNLGNVEEIDVVDGFKVSILVDGKVIDSSSITSRTTIRYASDQYLGSREEEQRAHHQLAQDNANKLLRYIDARLQQLP